MDHFLSKLFTITHPSWVALHGMAHRKGRGIRDQIANTHWIIEKAREFQKIIYLCLINYTEVFDYVDHNKLWKALKEM